MLGCALALGLEGAWPAVYTWTDEDGVRHYADTPVAGAREVRIVPHNVYHPVTPATALPAPPPAPPTPPA
ncbi:MAG: DUF4124 domain-containing protein, partial [Gammaproteobacteria bacterium]